LHITPKPTLWLRERRFTDAQRKLGLTNCGDLRIEETREKPRVKTGHDAENVPATSAEYVPEPWTRKEKREGESARRKKSDREESAENCPAAAKQEPKREKRSGEKREPRKLEARESANRERREKADAIREKRGDCRREKLGRAM